MAIRRAVMETLESRQLLSATLSNGTLTVTGTSGVDTLVVRGSGSSIFVGDNGVQRGPFASASVTKVVINALAGNDTLRIDSTVSKPGTLNGGDGNDHIGGGSGNDTLNGGNGNDRLGGGAGRDVFNGNAGSDTVDYSVRSSAVGIKIDNVANDGGKDEFDNIKTDVENAIGSNAADTIIGSDFNNVLNGGGGDDAIDPRRGADTVIGGAGNDSVTYATRTAAVRVSLNNIADDGEPGANGGAGEKDNIRDDVENVFGGGGSDTLTGSSRNNFFRGNGGNDTLNGGAGDDRFDGGAGNDTYNGGSGIDAADYSARTGDLDVSTNNVADDGEPALNEKDNVKTDVENVIGGAGSDVLTGGTAKNTLIGNGGDDTLNGGPGDDLLNGGDGSDVFNGDAGDDIINNSGDDGSDVGTGGPGFDFIQSPGNDDSIDAEYGFDQFSDQINLRGASRGGSSASSFNYGGDEGLASGLSSLASISSSFDPGTGRVTVNGTSGGDDIRVLRSGSSLLVRRGATTVGTYTLSSVKLIVVNGLAGDDRVELTASGTGAVTISSVINGGSGNDVLLGGAGNDVFACGPDSDAAPHDGNDTISGRGGTDKVDYSSRDFNLNVNLAASTTDGALGKGERDDVRSDIEVLFGGRGNDTLTGGNNAEIIAGGTGNDTIAGNGKSDYLVGFFGQDRVLGGEGLDYFILNDGAQDRYNGGSPGDVLQLDSVDVKE